MSHIKFLSPASAIPERRRNQLAKLALLTVSIAWGSSLVVVKGATDSFPPLFLNAMRFSIGCGVLALIFHDKLCRITRKDLKSGTIIGFLLFLAYSTQTFGVVFSMPGKSAFLSSIYCVIVPFLYWLTGGRRPDRYTVSAAVLCVAGLACSSLNASFSIEAGDTLAILSGFFFAAHIVSVTKCGSGKDPIMMTIIQFGSCAVLCWGMALLRWDIPETADLPAVGGLLYLGLVCTAFALLLQNVGQKYADPSSAAILLSLESVFGVLFSIIFFHEQMTLQLFFGFALIFFAILLSETKLSFLKKPVKRSSTVL